MKQGDPEHRGPTRRRRVLPIVTAICVIGATMALSTAPASAAVAVNASPSSNLTAPTAVTVTITGLGPFQPVSIGQCDGPALSLFCVGGGFQNADASGTLVTQFAATPIIDSLNGPYSCRGTTCFLLVVDQWFDVLGVTTISFTSDATTTPGEPTVDPSTGLVDGQVVTLDVPMANLPGSFPIEVGVCVAGKEHFCIFDPIAFTGPLGDLNTTLAVTRFVPIVQELTTYDCLVEQCVVYVSGPTGSDPRLNYVSVPISFVAGPPPTTTTTAAPTTSTTAASVTTSTVPASTSTTRAASSTTNRPFVEGVAQTRAAAAVPLAVAPTFTG